MEKSSVEIVRAYTYCSSEPVRVEVDVIKKSSRNGDKKMLIKQFSGYKELICSKEGVWKVSREFSKIDPESWGEEDDPDPLLDIYEDSDVSIYSMLKEV